jgi:hypothetical protein
MAYRYLSWAMTYFNKFPFSHLFEEISLLRRDMSCSFLLNVTKSVNNVSIMHLMLHRMWGTLLADTVIQMLGTDYARIVQAIYAFAQVNLTLFHYLVFFHARHVNWSIASLIHIMSLTDPSDSNELYRTSGRMTRWQSKLVKHKWHFDAADHYHFIVYILTTKIFLFCEFWCNAPRTKIDFVSGGSLLMEICKWQNDNQVLLR